jgi:DNA invertase Pin-like site-specific DNA recombinase
MPTKVAGYLRVSQAREGMKAPELYEDEITRYCSFKGWGLGEVFSDIDFSGYNNSEGRPGLRELVRRRAEFSAVIVPKLSRFGRSLKHLAQLFDTFDRDGISLVFLDMNIDSSTSQGRLLRHIMAAFAEYESDVKADYARANYRHAMQQGRTWGLPPYGYRAENKRYHVVEDEAVIVRAVYERYIAGASLTRIATDLNAMGLLGRKGGMWRTKHIGRILDNPAYAGVTVLGAEVFDARWVAIVGREEWDRVQHLRLPENRGQRTRKEGTGGPYLLSGLIVCGTCGAKAHHHRKTGACVYQCMRQHHSEKCDGGGVSRPRAEGIVIDAVLERVRFRFDADVEFVSARDAWDRASLQDRRRLLGDVLERVVIETRGPHEARMAPRRIRVEWKAAFAAEGLVAMPLGEKPPPRPRDVSSGRVESQRASRNERAKSVRSKRSSAYFAEWAAVRRRLAADTAGRSTPDDRSRPGD